MLQDGALARWQFGRSRDFLHHSNHTLTIVSSTRGKQLLAKRRQRPTSLVRDTRRGTTRFCLPSAAGRGERGTHGATGQNRSRLHDPLASYVWAISVPEPQLPPAYGQSDTIQCTERWPTVPLVVVLSLSLLYTGSHGLLEADHGPWMIEPV